MPIDYSNYPPNWKEISHFIRFERAGGKCEICGVEHGAYILWDKDGKWYDMNTVDEMLPEQQVEMFGDKVYNPTKIILTTHHIGIDKPNGEKGSTHDKMDCRPENLIALCQKHHLEADMPTHIAKRKETLLKKKHEAILATGQLPLFGVD